MQILKGEILKSVTVENILKSTDSYCYVYYDHQLLFDNYYVNSKVASLKQLQGYLQEHINYKNPEKYYDYLIVYTNNTQEELLELISWLEGKEIDFNCRCILLTCKL